MTCITTFDFARYRTMPKKILIHLLTVVPSGLKLNFVEDLDLFDERLGFFYS